MKNTMWRTGLVVALVSLLAFAVVGCSTSAEEPAQTESQEITVMLPEWGVPTDAMLQEFQDESGVKANVEVVAWDDIRNKISVAAAGGQAAADVVEVDWSWVGEFNNADWLEPLTVTSEDTADIPSISSFTVDGKVLGIPYANDFRVGYYNTDIYGKAGLTEPVTFAEVKDQSAAIKQKGLLQYPSTMPLTAGEGTTTGLLWLTFLRDGKVFNDDNTLSKDNVLTSLRYMDSLVKDGLINPANITQKDIDTYRQLSSGEAAFMVGPTYFVGLVENPDESKVVGQIKTIVPPGGDSKAKQTMSLTEGVGILKASENKEAAQKFVDWYTSAATQKQLYTDVDILPTRTSVLTELVNSGQIKNADALIETAKLIKSPFPNGVPAYYSEMSPAIYNAINQMASGSLTPEQAFDEMNAKVTELAKSASQ